MSCDWNVYCVTCKSEHGFSDANHQEALMWKLCRNAKAIGGLAELVRDESYDVAISTPYGTIEPSWFAAHADHELVPIDEYGKLATECGSYSFEECDDCARRNGRRHCARPAGHEGAHSNCEHGHTP
jgi:hypothetical protein